ncbi:hypothetical protein V491_03422 [Pseudogymnoascus sp. VKM F-3775]|nr:hypothetical protein V491_03422 [Pseudogymnoascus sp. VKM F-3775]
MHLTTLEITHSLPPRAIAPLLSVLDPAITALVSYPSTHPSRLVKPLLSFDASAVALSFIPADDGKFTYHHLRRSLFEMAKSTGIEIESRYVVPSAHITLCRFLETKDHATEEKMRGWIEKLEGINGWLVKNYWAGNAPEDLEWMVDELALWVGRVWYGDGEMVAGEGVTWNGVAAMRPGEYSLSQGLQGHHLSRQSS